MDFRIEYSRQCSYDFLEIEEHSTHQSVLKRIGRFCGYKNPPDIVVSSYNDISVRFVSDTTIKKRGVRLRYSRFL